VSHRQLIVHRFTGGYAFGLSLEPLRPSTISPEVPGIGFPLRLVLVMWESNSRSSLCGEIFPASPLIARPPSKRPSDHQPSSETLAPESGLLDTWIVVKPNLVFFPFFNKQPTNQHPSTPGIRQVQYSCTYRHQERIDCTKSEEPWRRMIRRR